MSRRTPILAFLLAPVALIVILFVWQQIVVPLSRTVWFSDTLIAWRLGSDRPETRVAAARAVGSRRTVDVELLSRVVEILAQDESPEVRQAAAGALGQIGNREPLPGAAIEALSSTALSTRDPEVLSATIIAVGRSAVFNRYPEPVVERIAEVLRDDDLSGVRSAAVSALGELGATQPLPKSAIAGLAAAYEVESNPYLRAAMLRALGQGADLHPAAHELIVAAATDPDPTVASGAESALRIREHNLTFRDASPLVVATDTSRSTAERLDALRILRATPIAEAAREPIAELARDPDPDIAIAALGMFRYLARAPEEEFDQQVLIPALTRALTERDARIREAAYGALSMIAIQRPDYLGQGELPQLLEAGSRDSEAKVRVVAMVARLRGSNRSERTAIVDQGLADPDPHVRANAATWLASPETRGNVRQELLARALEDPDPNVRAAAESTRSAWDSRERAWPVELWRLWREGERGQVGMKILTTITIATPILICGGFLLFFTARFLALIARRSWRAATVVPVVAVWAAASYGLFLLYFLAGHAGDVDGGELVVIVAILWGAIGLYTLLGWGLHFAMRG